MRNSINWNVSEENQYRYEIYEIGEKLPGVPGNFCFAKEPIPNRWTPVFFGQTEDLSQVLTYLDEKKCINSFAATHVHIRLNSDQSTRLSEMNALIEMWNTPCNK